MYRSDFQVNLDVALRQRFDSMMCAAAITLIGLDQDTFWPEDIHKHLHSMYDL